MVSSRWLGLLILLNLISCTNQQTIVNATSTNTFVPSVTFTAKPTLTQTPYPTRTPVITATPILLNSDNLQDIVKMISEYYQVSRCVSNLANPSLNEWLGQPADKPELLDFTNQFNFNKVTIEEIADSTNNRYRAYLVVEPNLNGCTDCFQSRVYVEDLSTNQIFRIDWSGYMSWRFIYGATWFGDKVLTFEQSINPHRVEIVGIDMEKQDYVYHIAYTPKDACPVETP